MNFFRRLGLSICASIFSLSIFVFAFGVSAYMVFHTPTKLESALQQSGIYNVAVQNELAQSGNSAIPLNDPAVQSAVQSALPASSVQSSTEQVINNVYGWLQGTTQSLNFNVDLTQAKSSIADNLGTYLQQKLSALPVCPPGTPLPDPSDTAALFSITCRPAGVSVSSLVSNAQKAAQGNAVIKDDAITPSTFKDNTGQPLSQKYSYLPKAYHDFVLGLLILPAVIILSALSVIFASSRRRAGVRRLCTTLVTTGLYSIVVAVLAVWLLNHAASSISSQATGLGALQDKIVKVADVLVGDLRKWWLGFGIGYITIGIIGWIMLHATRPKRPKMQSQSDNPLGHNMDIPQAGTKFAPKDDDAPVSTPLTSPTDAIQNRPEQSGDDSSGNDPIE